MLLTHIRTTLCPLLVAPVCALFHSVFQIGTYLLESSPASQTVTLPQFSDYVIARQA